MFLVQLPNLPAEPSTPDDIKVELVPERCSCQFWPWKLGSWAKIESLYEDSKDIEKQDCYSGCSNLVRRKLFGPGHGSLQDRKRSLLRSTAKRERQTGLGFRYTVQSTAKNPA